MKYFVPLFCSALTFLTMFMIVTTYERGIQVQAEILALQINQIQGKVVKTGTNTLSVQTDQGIKEVNIPLSANIQRNKTAVHLEDLQPDDVVTIMHGANGEVLAVDSSSDQDLAFGKYKFLIEVAIFITGLAVTFGIWKLEKKLAAERPIRPAPTYV